MNEFLTHINGIQQLSKQAEEALVNSCSPVTIQKGKDLQTIGNRCKNIYFVKSGILRIYYLKDELDVTESFEFKNAFVARADSLFDSKPSRKGIQAVETSELIAIDSAKLFTLYDEHHDVERLFRKVFERAYIETVERLESLQFHSAEERYHNLLEKSNQIIQQVPLNHIASYLGITQVSLSRIRAKY
jgi:CRP-like cAMP-binding protein